MRRLGMEQCFRKRPGIKYDFGKTAKKEAPKDYEASLASEAAKKIKT